MKNKSCFIQVFFLLLPMVVFAKTTITVNDQKGFDNMQQQVLSCIKSGEKVIHVTISSGTYVVKEKHLTLNNLNAPDVKVQIMGNGAVLIPEGHEYRSGEKYVGTFDVNNSWMNGDEDVETWSHVRYADGQVEILNATGKACRIKSKRAFPANIDCSNAYIMIPHWYQSSVYKIDKIDNQYIYFVADDLKESSYAEGYNVNDDYIYGKKEIRYKLCNVETGDDYLRIVDGVVRLPQNINMVREGKTHRFLTIQNSKFASVEIAGLQIRGNAFAESNPAIYIKNSECKEIRIHNCVFSGMRGNVISVTASPNVTIELNKFVDCYYFGIKSNNESVNTIIKDNTFESMGKRMSNTSCVKCQGTDYCISDNVFANFGYCGISTGVWYKTKKEHPCTGIIENNELSFDHDYLDNIDNYGIMDGGAIYIATKNDGSVVRFNNIHGFSGMKSNRGIFCDDGAYNVEIYGNIITGIANSRCIDSRRVTKVESSKTPTSGIDQANVNVVIRDNIVDGSIRFVANESKNNGCVKGANYILVAKDGKMPENVLGNVADMKDDIMLNYNGVKNGRIGLSPSSYRKLKKTDVWQSIRHQFVKKRR